MRWRRLGSLTAVVLALLVAPRDAGGQVSVRLSGQIETNGGIETLRSGDRKSETITTGSSYAPNLDGFIWDPRFLTFSLGGTYTSQDTTFSGGESSFVQRDPYRLQFTLFPQAAHSFSVLASRSISDNTFSSTTVEDMLTTTTTQREGVAWTFRGSPSLPETLLDLKRQNTETETATTLSEETRTTLMLRARKSFARSQPTATYTAERLETAAEPRVNGVEADGMSHQLQYEDRILVGERVFLSPTAHYRIAPETQDSSAALTLAGPLSATLDGNTGLRYSFQESSGVTTQTVSTDGVLTKRFSPTLTLTTGVTGVMANSGSTTWSAGSFTGVSAQPLTHLQNTADYNLQFTGGETPLSVSHRGHFGAISTFVPRHTLTADYFLNVFDQGESRPLFTSHSAALGVTSLVIPRTAVTGRYSVDLQEGDGEQRTQTVSLSAVVTPVPLVSVRGGGAVDTKSTSGGGRAPTEETGWAADGGLDVSPLTWLTLSVSGRRAVRDVEREDKTGRFVSEVVRGTVTVTARTLQFRAEGFAEREPIIDQSRQGVRGSASYRFRIWTITLDFERSSFSIARIDTERERLFLRVTRPLDFVWPPR